MQTYSDVKKDSFVKRCNQCGKGTSRAGRVKCRRCGSVDWIFIPMDSKKRQPNASTSYKEDDSQSRNLAEKVALQSTDEKVESKIATSEGSAANTTVNVDVAISERAEGRRSTKKAPPPPPKRQDISSNGTVVKSPSQEEITEYVVKFVMLYPV